jgi:hypothetical protein
MVFLSSLDRLSWDNRGPAPFESAANVFLKVMLVNSMSFSELVDLVRRPADECRNREDYIAGDWVDFNRFSSLLKVDQRILKQGFIDWLGFERFPERDGGIRRCFKCTQLRYHCSLFHLRVVANCPWHNCPLGYPCQGCVQQLFGLGSEKQDWQFYEPCDCGFDLGALLRGSSFNLVPKELADQIERYCRQFVGWWATVKQQQKGASDLLAEVSITGGLPPNYYEKIALSMGLALKIAPFPAPWKHSIDSTASRVIELTPTRYTTRNEKSAPQDAMHEFSSVRRFVFRRYVRSHRKCLRAIRAMKDGERQYLDGNLFCSVCVAYLSWIGPMGLARKRIPAELYHKVVDSHWSTPLKFDAHGMWGDIAEHALVRFFNVWTEIELKIDSQNLYVVSSQSRKHDADYPHAIYEVANETSDASSARHALWLTGDDDMLAQRTSVRCAKRRALRKIMVDEKRYKSWCQFSWGNSQDLGTYDGYTQLFTVRSSTLGRNLSFTTIYV